MELKSLIVEHIDLQKVITDIRGTKIMLEALKQVLLLYEEYELVSKIENKLKNEVEPQYTQYDALQISYEFSKFMRSSNNFESFLHKMCNAFYRLIPEKDIIAVFNKNEDKNNLELLDNLQNTIVNTRTVVFALNTMSKNFHRP
jgi:hypothetical protein